MRKNNFAGNVKVTGRRRTPGRRILAAALAVWCMISCLMGNGMGSTITAYAKERTLPSGISYDEVGARVEGYVSEHEATTAGMAVAVFDREETLYQGYFGYANREEAISTAEDTVFEWGSATKLLVWVSVMQLWEQGKLELDKDVREYLPEGFLHNIKYDKPVTMLHLMNHTAGFQETYLDIFLKNGETLPSFEEALAAHQPAQIYEPGTVTAYSNWGVALAASVVEEVSGMTFCDYAHQYIFEPLGMEQSAVFMTLEDNPWVQEKRKELACYTAEGELIPDCFNYIVLYPVGMCTSTIGDFERFAQALLAEDGTLFGDEATYQALFSPTSYYGEIYCEDGYDEDDSHKNVSDENVLNANASDENILDASVSDAGSYAETDRIPRNCHGFWVLPFGIPVLGHGGNTEGCSSYLYLAPREGVGAVVMTNQSSEEIYNEEMMELIFGSFEETAYFPEGRELPEGIFRTARTVRKGPFKILSMSYGNMADGREDFWVYMEDGEKVSYPYADLLPVSAASMILELGLALLWLISAAFALISLILCVVRRHASRWNLFSCGSILVSLALLAAAGVCASSYLPGRVVEGICVAIAVLLLLLTGLFLYGIFRVIPGARKKGYPAAVLFALAAVVANILYWNLFMFWIV